MVAEAGLNRICERVTDDSRLQAMGEEWLGWNATSLNAFFGDVTQTGAGSNHIASRLAELTLGWVGAWEAVSNHPFSRVEIKTLQSGDRLISNNLLNAIPEILPEEVIAFHRYTVSSFSMNEHLNAGQQLVGFEAELRSLVRSGINKLQNSTRRYVDRIYRGQSLPENLILEKYVLPFQQGQALGGPVFITENAFLSTTRSEQIAGNFV